MPESTKERGGPERPAGGGRNIRRKPLKSTAETAETKAIWAKIRSGTPRLLPENRPPISGKRGPGEGPEWSIGTVSKTVVRASVPWVRIPPSPPPCFELRRSQGKPCGVLARSRVPSEALAKEGGRKGTRRSTSISSKAKTTLTKATSA